ncbi:hypothetical protein BDW75DRAFT_248736 [Aspergillus navahoensis]
MASLGPVIMDLFKSRITFASMHVFEDIGVRELEEKLIRKFPQADSHCEYSKAEDILVIRGKLEGLAVPITVFISSFIERNSNASDLLEAPRLRALGLPTGLRDECSLGDEPGNNYNGGLLLLDDDPSRVIPHPFSHVTKFWLPAAGGLGCFAYIKHREMLSEVAKHTGTEIAVVDELKGLQVSGGNEGDVNDAIERLSRIEEPLSRLGNPGIENIAIGLTESGNGWMIQAYEDLHSEAPRHILTDSSMRRMFVTTLYTFNEDTRTYSPSKNLVEPLRCRHLNEKSRIWSDFVFQEICNGDSFTALNSMAEINDVETRLVLTGVVKEHPYLSAEKAKQVSEWVVEGFDVGVTEAAPRSESFVSPLPPAESPTKRPLYNGIKKAPGIKVRRPMHSRADALRSAPEAASSALPQDLDGPTKPPRNRWEMAYQFHPSVTPNGKAEVAEVERSISNCNPSSDESAANFLKPESISHNHNELEPTSLSSDMAAAPAITVITSNLEIRRVSKNMPSITNRPLSEPHTKPVSREEQLIDVNSAVQPPEIDLSHIRLEMTSLIPSPSVSGGGRSVSSSGAILMSFADEKFADLGGSRVVEPASALVSTPPGSLVNGFANEKQEARLERFNHTYSRHFVGAAKNPPARPCQRSGDYSRILEERAISDLERVNNSETVQSINETKRRKYHRTMAQKAAKPGRKAKSKASSLAKKQATLEDAWGISKQKKPVDRLQGLNISSERGSMTPKTEGKRKSEKKQNASVDEDFGRLFVALTPILKAAEAFPGIVTFELQFGLVLIPKMPKTRNTSLISSTEWSEIFQPRNGMPAPTTKFVNRLTACGSEIDHIVNLRTSKAEGKSRIFEEEYSEYNIRYEFHCRTSTDELLLIIIDEQGGFSIQHPKSSLGAVNIHFPQRIWDARTIVESAIQYRPGSRPDLEDLGRYLVDHLWVLANNDICIYTLLPKANKTTIEKVVMKRWTRHRYLRPGEGMRDGTQDIFLQVTEVQDLFLGSKLSPENHHVRARYTNPEEMRQRGKTWYELSLVSPMIETILRTNAALEVGERTEEWRSADLFGDAEFYTGQQPTTHKSSVAAAIGAGSVAQMLQMAKALIEKMDGVGACNRGPMIPGSPQVNKGMSHDDIQSVKEVESVKERDDPAHLDIVVLKRELHEQEYW